MAKSPITTNLDYVQTNHLFSMSDPKKPCLIFLLQNKTVFFYFKVFPIYGPRRLDHALSSSPPLGKAAMTLACLSFSHGHIVSEVVANIETLDSLKLLSIIENVLVMDIDKFMHLGLKVN